MRPAEAAAYQTPWYDDTSWLHRPDVHGRELCSALMSGLIAPPAPDEARWETLWMYAQGGPGVFRGDLHFYRVEGDLRDRVHRIDATRCPLYLLTGEYDFSRHARGHAGHRGPHSGRAPHGHGGARPLPGERESRALSDVPATGPRRDPPDRRGQTLTFEQFVRSRAPVRPRRGWIV